MLSRIVLLGLAAALALPAEAASHGHKRRAHRPAVAAAATPRTPADASAADERLLEAREALNRRDRKRLISARDALAAARHPLLIWAEYWELSNRLYEVSAAEIESFYSRWPGSYLEDRLRNDWLLELGRRRDFARIATEYPRFRMNDDREVVCYALLARHMAGEDVRDAARSAWMAQKDGDDGCLILAQSQVEAGRLSTLDLWIRARRAAAIDKPRAVQQALGLLGVAAAQRTEITDRPQRFLASHNGSGAQDGELAAVALIRLAAQDPAEAASRLEARWLPYLAPNTTSFVWAAIAYQASFRLMPDAEVWYQRATAVPYARDPEWSDEMLGWRVRSALRGNDPQRWQRILDAIDAMSPAEQGDSTWLYWKGRALLATARPGPEGEPRRLAGRQTLEALSVQMNFYGQLAAEDLNRPQALPPTPLAPTAEERQAVEQHDGIRRALLLLRLGLRSEGVREWNYSMREQSDRTLLAAARFACEQEIWDRCIHASDRTRSEIDMALRFPTPFREDLTATAADLGVDPAYVYGLIRQESRFVTVARSHVGAAGLMQVMPGTARWTARKLGMSGFTVEQLNDRKTNLRIGTGYMKMVLDSFAGSEVLAAAAYNAGPSRPRRWREGPEIEAVAWIENIPFNETRDYVKKVLSNAGYYAALLGNRPNVALKPRLGAPVGPRPASAPADNPDLP
jgi:soluble lytic murein transglycosylase